MSNITYGALLNVYNEDLLLPYCLEGLMPDIDQCVIVNASSEGPSTDNTKKVIDKYIGLYPNKIEYFEGSFPYPNGSWDEAAQVNFGLSKIDADFMIRIHADIIFDYNEIGKIKELFSRFLNKKFFYAFQRDFWVDTDHIKLYEFSWEQQLPHPISNDPIAISMKANPRAFDDDSGKFGVTADLDWQKDVLWLPDVKKYHFGFVKPFRLMFDKVLIAMKKGDFFSKDLMATLTEKDLCKRAFTHVKTMMETLNFDYAGEFPVICNAIKNISMRDGYTEVEEWIHEYLK